MESERRDQRRKAGTRFAVAVSALVLAPALLPAGSAAAVDAIDSAQCPLTNFVATAVTATKTEYRGEFVRFEHDTAVTPPAITNVRIYRGTLASGTPGTSFVRIMASMGVTNAFEPVGGSPWVVDPAITELGDFLLTGERADGAAFELTLSNCANMAIRWLNVGTAAFEVRYDFDPDFVLSATPRATITSIDSTTFAIGGSARDRNGDAVVASTTELLDPHQPNDRMDLGIDCGFWRAGEHVGPSETSQSFRERFIRTRVGYTAMGITGSTGGGLTYVGVKILDGLRIQRTEAAAGPIGNVPAVSAARMPDDPAILDVLAGEDASGANFAEMTVQDCLGLELDVLNDATEGVLTVTFDLAAGIVPTRVDPATVILHDTAGNELGSIVRTGQGTLATSGADGAAVRLRLAPGGTAASLATIV